MAPSQLKQLKKSLRESGITGPTRSKKNKTSAAAGPTAASRSEALAQIRENARPFDVQMSARPTKFSVTTVKSMMEEKKAKGSIGQAGRVVGQPAVAKGRGEQLRRQTLLVDLRTRSKAGGILDRRIGENNSRLTHEDKMQQRLVRELSRTGTRSRGKSLFDLENDEEADESGGFMLTHHGQEIDYDRLGQDIATANEEADFGGSGADQNRKRPFDQDNPSDFDDDEDMDGGRPERKKSKAEVMREVMQKSKMYKAERQMAHEEDMAMADVLNEQVPDLLAQLRGVRVPKPVELSARATNPIPKPAVIALTGANLIPVAGFEGKDSESDKKEVPTLQSKNVAYDQAVKQLAFDEKARPTMRSKTVDEVKSEYDAKMQELENARLRRMNGEIEPLRERLDQQDDEMDLDGSDDPEGDAAQFGFQQTRAMGRLEEEDDFELEDDMIASDSDDGDYSSDAESGSGSESGHAFKGRADDEDDLDFTAAFRDDTLCQTEPSQDGQTTAVVCPVSQEELVKLIDGTDLALLPRTIQQIRAGYSRSDQREQLSKFAAALIEYLPILAATRPMPAAGVIDGVLRHLQSMSRVLALPIGIAFRTALDRVAAKTDLDVGDVLVLTAIGTIFSTSDLFHPVALPALTIITRWLSLHTPAKTDRDVDLGTCLVLEALRYQSRAKRYIPECINFVTDTIKLGRLGPQAGGRLVRTVGKMADLWIGKPSFEEIFTPRLLTVLEDYGQRLIKDKSKLEIGEIKELIETVGRTSRTIRIQVSASMVGRRTVELHHHRPRAIRTAIPRFESNFDPDKHYDPDQTRAESAKLRAEHKREHKAAVRDLRNDAKFVARHQLADKKVRDAAYHEKMRKLVADVQTEEGREKNSYDRERRMRKMGR